MQRSVCICMHVYFGIFAATYAHTNALRTLIRHSMHVLATNIYETQQRL